MWSGIEQAVEPVTGEESGRDVISVCGSEEEPVSPHARGSFHSSAATSVLGHRLILHCTQYSDR
jgi:hypothetical protein